MLSRVPSKPEVCVKSSSRLLSVALIFLGLSLVEAAAGAQGNTPTFSFLPPISGTPAAGGKLNPRLQPIVEICELTATACGLPPIARFTVDLPEPERVSVTEQFYQAVWRTSQYSVNPDKDYRV